MKPRKDCPGCGSVSLSRPFVLSRQPVVLNYRFRDPLAAANVVRRDVTLTQCRRCGLVFNATFNPSDIPYDANYENRQCFSPAFNDHLQQLACHLIQRNNLTGGRILEVGCGKGDFLRRICGMAGAEGEGYDTSYEPNGERESVGLSFHQRYVSAADVARSFDAVLCRHVVEHVPEIGTFLCELRDIAAAAGDPVVVLETPRFEWIVEQTSIWDVFYEHCNYFPTASLAHLCRLAGFRLQRHRSVFGSQYQVIELKLAKTRRVVTPPGLRLSPRLSNFARRAKLCLKDLSLKIASESKGDAWAVWGAGAKGVALVNQLPGTKPCCVIDSNPAKQGGVLPGTRIPIVGPENQLINRVSLVLIANPNYASEIRESLRQQDFCGKTIVL
jgi:hypothetical protein